MDGLEVSQVRSAGVINILYLGVVNVYGTLRVFVEKNIPNVLYK